MRKLPEEIISTGFMYKQIKRNKYYALYSQTRIGYKEPWAWEVITIINTKRDKVAWGNTFEAGEYYPTSSEWGNRGWTFNKLSDAEKRYTELCAKPPKKDK